MSSRLSRLALAGRLKAYDTVTCTRGPLLFLGPSNRNSSGLSCTLQLKPTPRSPTNSPTRFAVEPKSERRLTGIGRSREQQTEARRSESRSERKEAADGKRKGHSGHFNAPGAPAPGALKCPRSPRTSLSR